MAHDYSDPDHIRYVTDNLDMRLFYSKNELMAGPLPHMKVVVHRSTR